MIVIPMVGRGSRFYNAGYNLPKFALPLNNGATTFYTAVSSFEKYYEDEKFIFIIREIDNFDIDEFLAIELKRLGIKEYKIIKLDDLTSGQAETVRCGLKTLEGIYEDEELTVFNIDSRRKLFEHDEKYRKAPYMEVFVGEGDHWSFAEFQASDNLLIRTTEKVRISEYCSNGLYYFNSWMQFVKIYDFTKDDIKRDYGETYIAPIYNYYTNLSIKCYVKVIDKGTMDFFGTPVEYEAFKRSNKI